ncbi:16S rRNA (cytosine(1402)-N(4))-methyltransferase RsmH [Patescibacteria group bacterium]|nr:16S rRNA (cytosine(1402)-N(4))-methyltransferase RsmH [Patescibacteria group bacterium]
MTYQHEPVLLQEVINGLNPQPGQNFIDGTVGGGGHAAALLASTGPKGRLLAMDRDKVALAAAVVNLKQFNGRVTFIQDSYINVTDYALSNGFNNLAGVLLDLGLSSAQLSDTTRGFSFKNDGPLDLRFDVSQGQTAADLLNNLTFVELWKIFEVYGQLPKSKTLARIIVEQRRLAPFRTTEDLLSAVNKIKGGGRHSLQPAALVWQALRIVVNNELDQLKQVLPKILQLVSLGGRLAIISFHSGEDRIVKDFFKTEAKNCLCPPAYPVCRCQHQARLKIITVKPLEATAQEIKINSRARSAKLRIAQVI